MKFPNFSEEKKLWRKGIVYVIGVDEVGRGCFAGPVVAAAVIFKKGYKLDGGLLSKINDSKLVAQKLRKILSEEIKRKVLSFAISIVGISTINKIGIGKATQKAMRKCIMATIKRTTNQAKNRSLIFVLADGFHIRYIRGVGLSHQKGIIKGDQKSISIAAASIIAKVYRDKLMKKLNRKYPGYGFSRNKGYGTKYHQKAMRKYGLSDIHRTSFNLNKFL